MSTIHINELSIAELGKTLGVDPAALKSHLVAEGTEAPKETKIGEVLSGFHIQKKTDYDTFIDNLGKGKYDEGRSAAIGMPLEMAHEKLIGEKKSFRLSKYEEAAAEMERIAEVYAQKKLKEAGIEPDKKVQQLTADIEQLRKNYSEKENAVKEWEKKYTELEQFGSKKAKVTAAVSAINLAAEGQVLQGQRTAIETLFFNQYDTRIEEGKEWVIEKATGKVLKTATLEPVPVDEVVKQLASIFPTKTAHAGRGDESGNGTITTDSLKGVTEDEIKKIISSKGLNLAGGEGRAIYTNWVKANQAKV